MLRDTRKYIAEVIYNVYMQHKFLWRNNKNNYFLTEEK